MMKLRGYWLLGLLATTLASHAGIMPYQSRIIFLGNQQAKSILLANSNDYAIMVQTWIDHGEGSPDTDDIPFVSTPTIFRLNPAEIKGVRILYNGDQLPQDRESLFWFNMYEIPPNNEHLQSQNSVLVTMNTQIKLLYRPIGVTMLPAEAIKTVTCHYLQSGTLECTNPSPLYLSVINAQLETATGNVETRNKQNLMLSPFSKKTYSYNTSTPCSGAIVLTFIDESGNTLNETLPITRIAN